MNSDGDHIKRLMRKAVDDAFKLQIGKLYAVWVIEPEANQPERAARGAATAIDVYKQAIAAIDEMEV